MELKQKTILSAGCAVVLASGLCILLIMLTSPQVSYFSISAQMKILIIILILSLLSIPLITGNLDRLPDISKVLGWTFIGLGSEFILFPIIFLIFIMNFSSVIGLVFGMSVLTLSFIFGLPAGLISIVMGITLIKRK
ncbi:MAG: hypothetical protein OIN87_01170 [Candidatus Methanoperedens sp.]|nr:hypothetical protein [Candidatus Methanoperedens sp.]